jgi:hydrocephalus-inducing protein
LIDVIHEPEFDFTDAAPKQQNLKTSCIIDRAGYDCAIKQMDFKPTLMYATRSLKFTVKNTSLVGLEYNFKIVNSQSGILDAGPYTIIPKKGTISPSCDEHFIVKFAPVEVENDFTRILSGNINHLNPN